MLYIFDLGNVIIDIDFKRVMGVWSNLSGTPLATLIERFKINETFQQYERGAISDDAFAQVLCEEMDMSLSFEQFSVGWQAVFIDLRPEVIEIMQRLRQQGHRVVVLSNTNRLHYHYWSQHYPQIEAVADKLYLSQELGMCKPDTEIYLRVLADESTEPDDAVFFDDNAENVSVASTLGITSVLVTDRQVIPAYFA